MIRPFSHTTGIALGSIVALAASGLALTIRAQVTTPVPPSQIPTNDPVFIQYAQCMPQAVDQQETNIVQIVQQYNDRVEQLLQQRHQSRLQIYTIADNRSRRDFERDVARFYREARSDLDKAYKDAIRDIDRDYKDAKRECDRLKRELERQQRELEREQREAQRDAERAARANATAPTQVGAATASDVDLFGQAYVPEFTSQTFATPPIQPLFNPAWAPSLQ